MWGGMGKGGMGKGTYMVFQPYKSLFPCPPHICKTACPYPGIALSLYNTSLLLHVGHVIVNTVQLLMSWCKTLATSDLSTSPFLTNLLYWLSLVATCRFSLIKNSRLVYMQGVMSNCATLLICSEYVCGVSLWRPNLLAAGIRLLLRGLHCTHHQPKSLWTLQNALCDVQRKKLYSLHLVCHRCTTCVLLHYHNIISVPVSEFQL